METLLRMSDREVATTIADLETRFLLIDQVATPTDIEALTAMPHERLETETAEVDDETAQATAEALNAYLDETITSERKSGLEMAWWDKDNNGKDFFRQQK